MPAFYLALLLSLGLSLSQFNPAHHEQPKAELTGKVVGYSDSLVYFISGSDSLYVKRKFVTGLKLTKHTIMMLGSGQASLPYNANRFKEMKHD